MYCMVATRPDIAFAVGNLCKFMHAPCESHWKAIKHLLRYLKSTAHLCLTYSMKEESTLLGYSDSDWAGDFNDNKSTSAYTFLLAGRAVSWSSRKQKTIACSSTEAEYMALSHAARELIWLRGLLEEIGCKQQHPTIIFGDNQGSIALSKNAVHHGTMKHVRVMHDFVREKRGVDLDVKYCPTEDMVADALTKPLCRKKHVWCREMLGLQELA